MAAKNSNQKSKNQTGNSGKNNKPVRLTPKQMEEIEAQQKLMDAQKREEKNRITSIVIFVLSILLFFVAVLRGEGIWEILHNFYIGILGWIPCIIMPIGCAAFTLASEIKKKRKGIVFESVCVVILVLFVSAFIHVVGNSTGDQFWDAVKNAYLDAPQTLNGGFIGGVLGWLLLTMGKAPAIILSLLFILADILLLSKLTVTQFIKKTATPVKKAVDVAVPYIGERFERKKSHDIDIFLDGEENAAPENKGTKTKKKKQIQNSEDAPSDILKIINEVNAKKKGDAKKDTSELSPTIDEIVENANSQEKKQDKPKSEKFVVPEDNLTSSVDNYKLPSVDLLAKVSNKLSKGNSNELKNNAQLLVDTLASFGVTADITNISQGPTVTRYELKPASGVRISKITNLADDIALNLAAVNVRIEAPIPGKAAVGIELPNSTKNTVSMRELIEDDDFAAQKSKLSAGLGKDIAGKPVYCDIAKMPHLLIAGTTGSGKSVCMNSIIVSILYRANPKEVKFLMIDPKKVEFSKYENIPHLLVPVVTDPRKASGALSWAVAQMLERYQKFSDTGVRDISGYNKYVKKHPDMEPMPQIVICIDELADLMMAAPKEVEDSICRLAQMARAAGMHLVIATQRPSVDVITGLIKANISSRIALTVSSAIDSRTILDSAGAERLLGYGDMLYSPIGSSKPLRVQGCYISDEEVEKLCDYIRTQSESEYSEDIQKDIESRVPQDKNSSKFIDDSNSGENLDPLFNDAVEIVIDTGKASTSFLQRKLGVGYARGSKIMDQMEEKGIIGPQDGAKPRNILINKQQWIQMQAQGPAPDFTADNTEQMNFDDTQDSYEVIDNQGNNEDF